LTNTNKAKGGAESTPKQELNTSKIISQDSLGTLNLGAFPVQQLLQANAERNAKHANGTVSASRGYQHSKSPTKHQLVLPRMMNEELILMNELMKLPQDATLDGTRFEIKAMQKYIKPLYQPMVHHPVPTIIPKANLLD
jgi:hypothetical protein